MSEDQKTKKIESMIVRNSTQIQKMVSKMKCVMKSFDDPPCYQKMRNAISVFSNGESSKSILDRVIKNATNPRDNFDQNSPIKISSQFRRINKNPEFFVEKKNINYPILKTSACFPLRLTDQLHDKLNVKLRNAFLKQKQNCKKIEKENERKKSVLRSSFSQKENLKNIQSKCPENRNCAKGKRVVERKLIIVPKSHENLVESIFRESPKLKKKGQFIKKSIEKNEQIKKNSKTAHSNENKMMWFSVIDKHDGREWRKNNRKKSRKATSKTVKKCISEQVLRQNLKSFFS